jgi:hypothetical protein
MHAFMLLIPQFMISFVSWIQLILSMNRFRGIQKFSRTDAWALVVFLHAAFVRWIAALAVVGSSMQYQIFAALVSATLGWISFVVVFNEGFLIPSQQQIIALVMSIIITLLWEVNNRILTQME